MNRRFFAAILAALLTGAALTHAAGAGTSHPAQPVRIGSVDLASVFKEYKKSGILERKINDERDRLKADLDAIRAEIGRATRDLDGMDPKSEEYAKKDAERQLLAKKFDLSKEALEKKIRSRWEEYSLEIVTDIQSAVRAIGAEQEFTAIVQVRHDTPSSDTVDHEQLLAMSLQSILYTAPALDITADVTQRLNGTSEAAPSERKPELK
jgi:Skp family chaperone for outer membrane proteins